MVAEDRECLVVGVEEWTPQVLVFGPDDNLQVMGCIAEALKIILNHLGYCYKFIRSPDRVYGIRQPNGSWVGLNGFVQRGEANMTGVAQMVTEDRFEDFSVSEYILMSGLTAMHKRPRPQPDMTGFVKPFDLTIWALLIATLLVVLGASVAVRWYYNRFALRGGNVQHVVEDSVAWTVNALLCQSVGLYPRGDSVRMLSGVWLITAFILGMIYRANLKAMLILPKIILPFESLEDLVDTDIKVWAPTGSLFKEALENFPEDLPLCRLQEKLIKNQVARTDLRFAESGLFEGDFAAIVPRMSVDYLLNYSFSKSGYCDIYAISSNVVSSASMSFIFAKDSPLKSQFDPVIRRLRESGIIDYLCNQQLVNASECKGRLALQFLSELRPLALGDFYGVFMLYAGGIMLGLMSFALECIQSHLSQDVS